MGSVPKLIFEVNSFVKLSCKDQFFIAIKEDKSDKLKGFIMLNDKGSSGNGIRIDDSKDKKTIDVAKIVVDENLIFLYLNHR